ncbi:MAG: deiodinase family protein, partial [Gemmataceae bacterium]|nr:deiodinase family protein [Gemmataceae bacterium]
MIRLLAPAVLLLAGPAAAQPPKLPAINPDKMADPKEAARVADELEKDYAGRKQPEAVRMLVSILRGRLGGDDGWFGPAETRYTWTWLAKRHGLEPAAMAVPRERFRGPADVFARLDRDGDGRVTPGDLDWSDRHPFVQQLGWTNRVFRRLDSGGDGKITREELYAFF